MYSNSVLILSIQREDRSSSKISMDENQASAFAGNFTFDK
jgi:hypothetical protein